MSKSRKNYFDDDLEHVEHRGKKKHGYWDERRRARESGELTAESWKKPRLSGCKKHLYSKAK